MSVSEAEMMMEMMNVKMTKFLIAVTGFVW